MRVVLGNRTAIHQVGDAVELMPKGKRATVVDLPDELTLAEAFITITHPQGVWANHAKADTVPVWVASDNDGLAALLAEHFRGIEIRDLEESQ